MEIMRASCSHCRGLPDLPPVDERPDTAGGSLDQGKPVMFEAKFSGKCVECTRAIEPGDLIARLGVVGRYACSECAPWVS